LSAFALIVVSVHTLYLCRSTGRARERPSGSRTASQRDELAPLKLE